MSRPPSLLISVGATSAPAVGAALDASGRVTTANAAELAEATGTDSADWVTGLAAGPMSFAGHRRRAVRAAKALALEAGTDEPSSLVVLPPAIGSEDLVEPSGELRPAITHQQVVAAQQGGVDDGEVRRDHSLGLPWVTSHPFCDLTPSAVAASR